MTKIYIVTVATHDDYYLPYLKKTCKNNGSELIILGYGEKWKGFNWKYQLVLKFLKKLNKDDIVCFVDGFDVICTRNLKDFKNTFIELKNKYNFKIITGEHKIVYNDIKSYFYYFLLKIYFHECKNKSLNSGTYAGYVEDLIYFLENLNKLSDKSKSDDQILLTKYCNDNPDNIYIDSNGELFLTLHFSHNHIDHLFKYQNNNLYYNNYQPYFIHGPGETYLDNLLIRLNVEYDYENKVNEKLIKDSYKKYFFRIKNGLPFSILVFIILSIFVFFILKFFKKIKK